MTDFDTWLTFAVGSDETGPGGEEGGWDSDDPSPENPTWRGIEYFEFCDWMGVPHGRLLFAAFRELCTRTVIGKITESNYWTPAQTELLPTGANIIYVDHCFNAGQGSAVRCLQSALGVEVGGIFGPVTRLALRGVNPITLIASLHDAIEADYRTKGSFPKYGTGWLGRNDRGAALAMKLATNKGP
ncbi:MAG: glycosyl hydrolase 108 family protein [Sulfuriferula sp.]|nr:glycosyl hydrolase 108 family protein [Sulfuriferula sp.]